MSNAAVAVKNNIDFDGTNYKNLIGFILSNAIAGELVAVKNYTNMATISPDINNVIVFLQEALEEASHARLLQNLAKELDVPVVTHIVEPSWLNIVKYVTECAGNGNILACYMAQDLMLETQAVVLYRIMSGENSIVDEKTSSIAKRILQDELQHLDSGSTYLAKAIKDDEAGFYIELKKTHDKIMPELFRLIRNDCDTLCDEMGVTCGTFSVNDMGSDIDLMKIMALEFYVESMDNIGVKPEFINSLVTNVSGFSENPTSACC
ncbi:long-chain fatty aldehyde decarbonylase [Psychromonas sp. Urea-02u-13]|uniref:long-chain fatty aldehyde decarbonylase n=1 Tax=Psychromonas sp. Urea-02u-13 TaxID=2058326 RepID=UPI000C32EE25|nr:ferritin-like domain-containing protein [Psychromonas sp. Urea-02u-13]PKG37880.1 hypothetical protein CXF74_16475 [Psychromonas sp. Urea-02u-13]